MIGEGEAGQCTFHSLTSTSRRLVIVYEPDESLEQLKSDPWHWGSCLSEVGDGVIVGPYVSDRQAHGVLNSRTSSRMTTSHQTGGMRCGSVSARADDEYLLHRHQPKRIEVRCLCRKKSLCGLPPPVHRQALHDHSRAARAASLDLAPRCSLRWIVD